MRIFITVGDNRTHHDRDEQHGEIGFEIAGADTIRIGADQVAKMKRWVRARPRKGSLQRHPTSAGGRAEIMRLIGAVNTRERFAASETYFNLGKPARSSPRARSME
jgi:hypothetical protein